MTRVFHHQFTVPALCGIVLAATLTLYFFWQKMAIAGVLAAGLWVLMTERVLHTTYTLTDDELLVSRGRLARGTAIRLETIVGCTPLSHLFGLSHYLLITYGAGHVVSVQPQNEREFIAELQKRLRQ